jgi:hypothetical protein
MKAEEEHGWRRNPLPTARAMDTSFTLYQQLLTCAWRNIHHKAQKLHVYTITIHCKKNNMITWGPTYANSLESLDLRCADIQISKRFDLILIQLQSSKLQSAPT